MAVPTRPLNAARKVSTELAAARLNETLETELGLGHDHGPEWDREAEQARDLLAERWGGFEHLQELDTSKRDRKGQPVGVPHGGRRRRASTSGTSSPPGKAAGKPSAPRKAAPARTTRPPRRASSSRRGAGRRALEQTGIPAAGRGAASFTLELLGLMLGLALLYLVLTSADRNTSGGVVAQTLTAITGAIGTFVAARDPLAPRARPAAASPAGSGASAGQVLAGAAPIGGFPRAGGPTGTRTTTTGVTTP